MYTDLRHRNIIIVIIIIMGSQQLWELIAYSYRNSSIPAVTFNFFFVPQPMQGNIPCNWDAVILVIIHDREVSAHAISQSAMIHRKKFDEDGSQKRTGPFLRFPKSSSPAAFST